MATVMRTQPLQLHTTVDPRQHVPYNQPTHTTHKAEPLGIDLAATPEIRHIFN
jgi:hypothetical protein